MVLALVFRGRASTCTAIFISLFEIWMGWFAARRNAALTLLPALTTLALITSYSERKVSALASITPSIPRHRNQQIGFRIRAVRVE